MTATKQSFSRFFGPAIVLFAAALALAPQLISGNSCGHDFDFHLISWFDCLNSWRHGILYPHWTTSANYGAGEPRFVFYSPFTWMLGAALGLVLPWPLVPVLMTFLLLAGSGLATRLLAREALDDAPATLAGCIAIFSGYALFTAYERTAFAELAGGLWIPLLLLFALRDRNPSAACLKRAFDGSTALLALAVAGAWLSNPTVGVMACYLLAAVALLRALLMRSWSPVLRAASAAALGIALVGVYLLPAAYEQRWVDIHQVTDDPGQTLENNWLFALHADPNLALHDQVLHTASSIAVLMIVLAFIAILACWLRGSLPGQRPWWLPLALIPAAVFFLQFSISRPLWNLLPDLRFLQFPWRWLLVLEAPLAVFLAAALWPLRRWLRWTVVFLAVAVFLAITAYTARNFFQPCDDEDNVQAMDVVYGLGAGFEGTNEYEPIGADNSLIATGLPFACLVADPSTVLGKAVGVPDAPPVWDATQGSCQATYAASSLSRPEHLRLTANLSHPGYLILRLRSYPTWRIQLNGQPLAQLPQRADGLIALPVPQGPVNLSVDWTTTPDVVFGRWLTALAVLALTLLCLLEQKLAPSRLS